MTSPINRAFAFALPFVLCCFFFGLTVTAPAWGPFFAAMIILALFFAALTVITGMIFWL